MYDYGHWCIDAVGEFDPSNYFGFIYEIEEISSGRIYIGRKQLKTKTKKSDNWRSYTSSSEDVKTLIEEKGKEAFIFRIVTLCSGKSQLTYEEEKRQFENDVLRTKLSSGEKKYFNKTIGYRRFAGVEKQTEQSKIKASISNTGKVRTEEHKLNYSKSKKGVPKSEEHKQKLANVNKGKKYTKETNSKKGKGPNGESLKWWTNGILQCRKSESPGPEWWIGRIGWKKSLDIPK